MKTTTFITKRILTLSFVFFLAFSYVTVAQTYREIKGWSVEVNNRLESFLNSTKIMKERKISVFDCDGTLFGQAPHYLADEAVYSYAKKTYENKNDELSKKKMVIIDKMLHGDNVGDAYVEDRIHFFAGKTPEEISIIGTDYFHSMYQNKFYPEMKELLANLEEYGFEVWVISASPEYLYQKFVAEELGIPVDRILGVKSIVKNGITTDDMVVPIPQDGGKAEVIQTYIKGRPLFVGGNSRGDMEMMNESVGLKLIVNADNKKVRTKEEDKPMTGYTVESYWKKEGAVLVNCKDVSEGDFKYVSDEWKVQLNSETKK
jgi:phosphoserine phosphatase